MKVVVDGELRILGFRIPSNNIKVIQIIPSTEEY